MEVDAPDLAGLYRRFATIEAHGSSPTYERLCLAIADTPEVLAELEPLPRVKRQPNLFLGALRLLGADVGDPTAALAFAVEHAEEVREVMRHRSTQTNEPARCAVLLSALALLPGPLAILEVGASAGLCLLYDRYRYRFVTGERAHRLGQSGPELTCMVDGEAPLPGRVPTIAARLGLDANPLDAAAADTARWLHCLIWPEHTERAERLDQALAQAADDPPTILAGRAPQDLPSAVEKLRAAAAPDATLVVVHSATVAYLQPADQAAFAEACGSFGARRVGLEGAGPTAGLGVDVPADAPAGRFLLTLDETILGHAHPHGRDLVWTATGYSGRS